MFENNLKYKSDDLFENTQILNATKPLKESIKTEFKQPNSHQNQIKEVTCISCGYKHKKADRIMKKYGVLATSHCPKCNCESYWIV